MTLPRFSLRLLLLAVAVLSMFCAWLRYERSVVANRGKLKLSLAAGGNLVFLEAVQGRRAATATVSWFRQQIGDVAIQEILVLPGAIDGNIAMAKLWFPEAEISPLEPD